MKRFLFAALIASQAGIALADSTPAKPAQDAKAQQQAQVNSPWTVPRCMPLAHEDAVILEKCLQGKLKIKGAQ